MSDTNNGQNSFTYVAEAAFHLFSHHITRRTPSSNEVQDTGIMLNPDAPASNYSRGLSGVDQGGNYIVSDISIGTFCFLLVCVLAYQVWYLAQSHIRQVVCMGRSVDQRFWMRNRSIFWARCKRHLIHAPLFRRRHNQDYVLWKTINTGALPGRLQALILTLYVLSNVAFCLAIDLRQDAITITAELRGRTGQLAALNLIPTVLFALRNNPLIFITRVSYESFNLLHRWAARLVVVESVIHTICWAANNIRSGGYDQIDAGLATSVSFQWGMVAMCTFALMFITALSPIRHKFYEIFLNSHRTLALLGLIGVYVHLQRAGLPQLPYIQLVFVFWAAELTTRYGKIWYLNYSRLRGFTQITVEALPVEACRVTFTLRRPWVYTPGCHVHAYLPTLAWWSSHPFSVAWAEHSQPREPLTIIDIEPEKANMSAIEFKRSTILHRSIISMPTSQGTEKAQEVAAEQRAWSPQDALVDRVSLICRARSGFTRKMYDKAKNAPGQRFTTWGALEGPYGGHQSFASYGTVVLFAGGVGITHCLDHAHHLLKLAQEGQCAAKKVLLVWSIPESDCLKWVRPWTNELLRMECRRDLLRIFVYVTRSTFDKTVVSQSGGIQLFAGRCPVNEILKVEMAQRIGAMAVTVCGPGGYADDVRNQVRPLITAGCVDFVEEAFTY